jgi:hypothetical protein
MRRFVFECKDGHEFDVYVIGNDPIPKQRRCPKCHRKGTRVFKPFHHYPDMGERRLSSLLPLNYTHATRGKVDVVEGHAGLREHLKRYNGTYDRGLEMP